jgi:hypothetical protein
VRNCAGLYGEYCHAVTTQIVEPTIPTAINSRRTVSVVLMRGASESFMCNSGRHAYWHGDCSDYIGPDEPDIVFSRLHHHQNRGRQAEQVDVGRD